MSLGNGGIGSTAGPANAVPLSELLRQCRTTFWDRVWRVRIYIIYICIILYLHWFRVGKFGIHMNEHMQRVLLYRM